MLNKLYWAAAGWTVFGLAAGLYYRELTRTHDVLGRTTQLGLVHTHALLLGTVMLLVLLALCRAFAIGTDRRLSAGFRVWNVGLAITVIAMTVKGTLQVLGSTAATSPAIAGVSGLGHMTLTAGFAVLFWALKPHLTSAVPASARRDEQPSPVS